MKSTKPKPFEKLSAAQKRVAIARDVVKQIRMGAFEADGGYAARDDAKPINQVELLTNPPCGGCAAGAAALSAIRLGNKFSFDCALGSCGTFKVLNEWFSSKQARLIESAYELFTTRNGKSRLFGKRFRQGNPRIVGIMKNIIANNGTFKP